MTNAKHTPGPWSLYDDSNDGKTNRIEIVAIGKTIAHIYHSVKEEDLPNARMIAAAPELLAALERIAELSYDSEATRVAREAIAKARGE